MSKLKIIPNQSNSNNTKPNTNTIIETITGISNSLLPTLISKLAIIALISTISIKIFNNLNNESNDKSNNESNDESNDDYINKAIILCLIILVYEFYNNRNKKII